MIAQFDIFKKEPHGEHRWIEAAMDLDAAKTRVRVIGSTSPGEYMVVNQRTGNQIVIAVMGPGNDGSTHISDGNLRPVLEKILTDAIERADADFGNLQLFDAANRTLRIAVHRGFSDEFLRFFGTVYVGEACACGTALKERKRVIVGDVMRDPIFDKDTRNTLLADNVRAVQSMPPFTREDHLIGMLSVHYRNPRISNERQTAISDNFLASAADLIRTRLET